MSRTVKLMIIALLVPAMIVGAGACFAQGSSSGDDDNSTEDAILIGLVSVVVAILIILGIKSDREWNSRAHQEEEMARQRALEEELEALRAGHLTLEERAEMEIAAGRADAGVGFEF